MKIAFDIDGTLLIVDHTNGRSVVNESLLNVLRWFHENGDEVYLWSSGGVEYAKEIAGKLNISDLVEVIEKPDFGQRHPDMDLAFDDVETNLAKTNIKVSPRV